MAEKDLRSSKNPASIGLLYKVVDMFLPRLREDRLAINDLLKRVEELEKTTLREAGVWSDKKWYRGGDMVTFDSCAWVCRSVVPTQARPGDGGDWRLVVRRGRDGRDGRNAA